MGVSRIDDELREDVLDVLEDLLSWRLAPARWERVEHGITAVERALAGRDPTALREAVAELDLAGPVRTPRIGSVPEDEPPPHVRDRAITLVHSLGGSVDDEGDPTGSADRGAPSATD